MQGAAAFLLLPARFKRYARRVPLRACTGGHPKGNGHRVAPAGAKRSEDRHACADYGEII